jgi:hypothetical protein
MGRVKDPMVAGLAMRIVCTTEWIQGRWMSPTVGPVARARQLAVPQ